jgi:hypothetical protein
LGCRAASEFVAARKASSKNRNDPKEMGLLDCILVIIGGRMVVVPSYCIQDYEERIV